MIECKPHKGSSSCPQPRIQRLLDQGTYTGIHANVKVEGPFIQLTTGGISIRRVYIAITESELIIVKQGDGQDGHGDEDVSRLMIDFLLPLKLVFLALVDNRSKTLCVCTCVGYVMYFQMCQRDSPADDCWVTWLKIIGEISGGNNSDLNGFRVWQSNCLLELYGQSRLDNVCCYRNKKEHQFMFVKQPFSLRIVESASVQTEPVEIKSLVGYGYLPNKVLRRFREKWPITLIDQMEMAGHVLYVPLRKKQWRLQTRKSSSWENLAESIPNDVKYHKDSLLKYLTNADKQIENDSTLSKEASWSLKKISKADKQNTNLGVWDSSDSEDNEEEDVETALKKYYKNRSKKHRSGKELWNIARSNYVKLADRKFQAAVNDLFTKCHPGDKKTLAVDNVRELPPFDVASEFTYRNRRLLLTIKTNEVYHYRTCHHRMIPVGIARLFIFNGDLARLVTSQILKGKNERQRAKIIRYFQQVCIFLLKSRDYQSLASILRGLVSFPVSRLAKTWDVFQIDHPWYFKNFLKMLDIFSAGPCNNYAPYNKTVKPFFKEHEPYIPWFEHFLWYLQRMTVSSEYKIISRSIKKKKKKSWVSRYCCCCCSSSEPKAKNSRNSAENNPPQPGAKHPKGNPTLKITKTGNDSNSEKNKSPTKVERDKQLEDGVSDPARSLDQKETHASEKGHVRFEMPRKGSRRDSLLQQRRVSAFEIASEKHNADNGVKETEHFDEAVNAKLQRISKRNPLSEESNDNGNAANTSKPERQTSGKMKDLEIRIGQSDQETNAANNSNNARKKKKQKQRRTKPLGDSVDDTLFTGKARILEVDLYDQSAAQQLFAFKLSAGSVDVQSRRKVRENLKRLIAPGITDYWLMMMSLELE